MTNQVHYKSGYKYQLTRQYEHPGWCFEFALVPDNDVSEQFYMLRRDCGELIIRAGYAWDGPSGTPFDTLTFIRASLLHDLAYQAIREKHLPKSSRLRADRMLYQICVEDGMFRARAWYVYAAVRAFGARFAATVRKERIAP